MTLTWVVIVWAVLGIVTLALAIYRSAFAAHSEEDVVHLGPGEEREIPKQVALARKMDAIDRWGITLTIIVVVIGLALAAAYLYQVCGSQTSFHYLPSKFEVNWSHLSGG